MNKMHDHHNSLSEVHGTVEVSTKAKGWRKVLSFLGPAYLISVGYMDPGNWATDIAGGSQFGYRLIWVLLLSNLMALLLQGLSVRLGIVRGRDLAQANREAYPSVVNFCLWILAEIAIAATDLAEVLGMAIGIQLLTGLPLIWGVAFTILDTILILYLQQLGMRKLEAFILALVIIIMGCFFLQIFMADPDWGEVVTGFQPSLPDNGALYIAIGIIGATVMPHNLYLHSALVQSRKYDKSPEGIRKALKFNRIDTAIALNIAFLVNASILILAASVFHKSGNTHIGDIREAYHLLPSFLGNVAPILFALALIAAGQSSTVTGTLAGQIVMEGYLRLRINPVLRRLITRLIAVVPAFLVLWFMGEDYVEPLLVFSQVLLSLQLGFAIIPLIYFVSDKNTMGDFVIKPITKILAWLMAALLVTLNIVMLQNEIKDTFNSQSIFGKALIILICLLFLALLIYIIAFPLFKKQHQKKNIFLHEHPEPNDLPIEPIVYERIAVALDFSKDEQTVLSHAMSMASSHTKIYLIHVVESAAVRFLGKDTHDYETIKDTKLMERYVLHLKEKGFDAEGMLGFKHRRREIIRMTQEVDAQLLIMGAHGHKGLKDFFLGSTIDKVRHRVHIPVMVVKK